MRSLDTSPYETVYRRLAASVGAGAPRVIGLAGAGRGQGTTTLAVGLARAALSHGAGTVLVVDAATRGRSAARLLARDLPGSARAENVDGLPGELRIGGAGVPALFSLAPDGGNGMHDDALREACAALFARFDFVVVDTGDVASVVPARWRTLVDCLVLVVDTNRETIESLSRLRKDLDDRGLSCDGFVLNKRRFHVPGFLYRLVR
ncbi:MAG: hypothetical protein RLW61_22750 [Gammaproteobacteria bacterium]